ncbi:hypothetical protein TYRP_012852 [Tyrophagus putrescentiae]|nr:hypothetical protein TYRP_012852 [Tyrophagus putrescentiae]
MPIFALLPLFYLLLLLNGLEEGLVGLLVHQPAHLRLVPDLDLEEPAVGVAAAVHQAGLLLEGAVHLQYRPGDGRVDLIRRLDALHGAHLFLFLRIAVLTILAHLGADLRALDVDDVAQRLLRVLGDAHRADGLVGGVQSDPLVLLAEANVCRQQQYDFGDICLAVTTFSQIENFKHVQVNDSTAERLTESNQCIFIFIILSLKVHLKISIAGCMALEGGEQGRQMAPVHAYHLQSGQYGQVGNLVVPAPHDGQVLQSSETVDGGKDWVSHCEIDLHHIHRQADQLTDPLGVLQ